MFTRSYIFIKFAKRRFFSSFLYEGSQNSTSFRLHKTWIYHHSTSKGGLELKAQGNGMLETAIPPCRLDPSVPTGMLWANQQTAVLCLRHGWHPLLSPPGPQGRAPLPCLIPEAVRSQGKPSAGPENHSYSFPLPQGLEFLTPSPSHMCHFHFSPSLGSSTPSPTQWPPNHKQQGGNKKCQYLIYNPCSTNTLWFNLKYLFYVICRF